MQFGHYIVDSGTFHITTVRAGNVESFVFLVEATLQQVVVDTVNNFILKLSDVLNAQYAHHVVIGHDCLLGRHVCNSNQLKLFLLSFFEWEISAWVLLILRDCLEGKQI